MIQWIKVTRGFVFLQRLLILATSLMIINGLISYIIKMQELLNQDNWDTHMQKIDLEHLYFFVTPTFSVIAENYYIKKPTYMVGV